MIRVILMDRTMEIWRKGKHRIHVNVSSERYECIRKILVKNDFTFHPTNFYAGVEAIKWSNIEESKKAALWSQFQGTGMSYDVFNILYDAA